MIPEDEAPSLNQTTLKIIALYRTDYWQVFHSRAIARNIDRNIQTVTVQLSKLVKAGILKSARRGKNLEFGIFW
jgi:predicted transcriptional regulator